MACQIQILIEWGEEVWGVGCVKSGCKCQNSPIIDVRRDGQQSAAAAQHKSHSNRADRSQKIIKQNYYLARNVSITVRAPQRHCDRETTDNNGSPEMAKIAGGLVSG